MAIKIEMLRCFAAVAQSGNLADAADRLGRTPSAVSMMLKQFESHLGAPLFESERKGRLTALGDFVLEEALGEIEHFERTVTAIEGFARSKSGVVRVAAVPSVAEAILPGVVKRFSTEHPGVLIEVRDIDSTAVLRELQRERVDLGLATGTEAGGEIQRELLFTDAFGVVCRSDHPLAAETKPLNWDGLEPWPFIANGVCAHIADEHFRAIFAKSLLMVRNTTSILAMVRAGIGITVLPRLVVNSVHQELSFVPIADLTAMRRIEILRRGHNALSPAAKSFSDAIRRGARDIVSTW